MITQKRILFTVLNWGLGHATRSIVVIDFLLDKKYFVVIASDGDALHFLQQHYAAHSAVAFEALPAYAPVYHASGNNFSAAIFLQLPKFLNAIFQEHKQTNLLIKKWNVAAVISDNRYGCYSAAVPSYIITHQLNIPLAKLLKVPFDFLLKKQLKKFSGILVPDLPNHLLSGDLSKSDFENGHFIGLLSRLKKIDLPIKYKLVFLLSGPEPQRSLLEEKIKNAIDFSSENLLVRGTLLPTKKQVKNSIDLADTAQLNEIVNSCEIIIARSGYSTLLDMAKIKHKKIICIPTPGQTEQEYLAKKLANENRIAVVAQDDFDLEAAIAKVSAAKGFEDVIGEEDLLKTTFKNIGL